MSSTNVHSEKQNNNYCAVAQIIPTMPEKGLDIPPRNAKPGPSRLDIENEELVLNISSVGDYNVKEDGTVIDSNTKDILGKVSLEKSKNNKKLREKMAPNTYMKRANKER